MPHSRQKEFNCADCGGSFIAYEARFCPRCRPKHQRKRARKYIWTPEREAALKKHYDGRVSGKAAQIARAFGWPCWQIKRRAREMGLSYSVDRKDWTDKETTFLFDNAGDRSVNWIAKKLGRSITSVVLKFKRLKISRRVRRGYTIRELELCFGIDHHSIDRWIREGKLRDRRLGTDRLPQQGGDSHCVSDAAVLEFITEHPMVFRLDKVDQFWFLDLMLNGALVRKALESAREEEVA